MTSALKSAIARAQLSAEPFTRKQQGNESPQVKRCTYLECFMLKALGLESKRKTAWYNCYRMTCTGVGFNTPPSQHR